MAIVQHLLDSRITNLFLEIRAHEKLYARVKEAEHQGEIYTSTIFHLQQDESIPMIRNFEEGIGFLAAEVGILLDGTYSYEAICDICSKITDKLQDRRAIRITSFVEQDEVTAELKAAKSPANLPKYMH